MFTMKSVYILALLGSAAADLPSTRPPVHQDSVIAVENFEIPKTCSFVYGDPHIFSFDQAKNDCQGEGDFILSKSLDTKYEIQARLFHAEQSVRDAVFEENGGKWQLGSANKALVINSGVAGEPVIEINAVGLAGLRRDDQDNPDALGEDLCNLEYYADGVKIDLTADAVIGDTVAFQRRTNNQKSLWSGKEALFHQRNFMFTVSGIFVQVTKGYSHDRFGCFFTHTICIPDEIKEQNLVGMLGNADGNKDNEWMTKSGDVAAKKPGYSARRDWCKNNFCVPRAEESYFNTPTIGGTVGGECTVPHGEALEKFETELENASPEVRALCDNNVDCIFDTIVTGDTAVGKSALDILEQNEKEIDLTTVAEIEDTVETDACTTPEGEVIACDRVEAEWTCEKMDFDFGFKMAGCDASKSGLFQEGLELTDNSPTCQIGSLNVGGFDVACSDDGMEATVTPTINAVVLVQSATGGRIYKDLVAGQTYTLTTGVGLENFQPIAEIEFCFKCPEEVVGSELIRCEADVKTCPDGTALQRDASDECKFPSCPLPAPPREDETFTPTSRPGAKGDPHFKTHGGEMYDFHGGCDMVLVDNPGFMDGLGMIVHLRTKIQTWWSYVESAAVRIGDVTVEIRGGDRDQWLFINGVAQERLEEKTFKMIKFDNFLVRSRQEGVTTEVNIHYGPEKLVMKSYNGFVTVELAAEGTTNFDESLGLLGRFPDGQRVGRDGVTLIEDANEFGQEWQVKSDEPKLFHSYDADWVVPAGQKCAMPNETSAKKQLRQRRLATGIPMEEAEKACDHLKDASDHKACVFDVLATQDTNMAAVW